MITTAKSIQKHINTGAVSFLLAMFLGFTSAYAKSPEPAQSSTGSASVSEGYTLAEAGSGIQSRSASTSSLGNFHHQSQARPTIWISNIGTLLFDDLDGDGYHSGFSLTIDVDSEFGDTDVYAKIYLEPSYTASVLLHTTERFSVYGTTSGDEYRVDTELRNNYVADNYSVSIDIHDAWSDELLATANERGFNNLRQLPLESADMTDFVGNASLDGIGNNHLHDDDYLDDHYLNDHGNDDVIVTEYGGLFHPAILLILAGGLLIRRRKR